MSRIPSIVFFLLVLLSFCSETEAQVVLSSGAAGQILFSPEGAMTIRFADGTEWGEADAAAFVLRTEKSEISAAAVTRPAQDRIEVRFEDGSSASFRTVLGNGFALFRLETIQTVSRDVVTLEMGRLLYPQGAVYDSVLGRIRHEGKFAVVGTASLNVRPNAFTSGRYRADRAGCSHELVQSEGKEPGSKGAKFTATCNEQAGGWSVSGIRYPKPIDLTGLKAIRAIVHGDGRHQALKIQPIDSTGAARDTYIPIHFTGWKECTVAEAPYDKITKPNEISGLNIYYNGLPAAKTVECRIDRIEAIVERGGKETTVLLEDFENPRSLWWTRNRAAAMAVATTQFGLDGSAFGILFGGGEDFAKIMPDFEVAAGLPSPQFNGAWNKTSPDIRRSYFFLTNFKETEFDDALEIATRGGFDRILILQNSWTRATGHYEVNTNAFPGGVPQLAATVKRFQDAGFKTGFHFLAASIDPPDTYLTPVPDDRLVYGPEIKLAADIAADAMFLPTAGPPEAFPEEDGGYMGKGRVLRLGDELIVYTERKTEEPFGFEGCKRGHLGTAATSHAVDSTIRHLRRAYGYHMIDLDTDLLPEVAGHFAKLADACNIDMMYFDGSELLQGEHWYYNAKLQRAFYDAVGNKNMLMQGSSYSPYSWHQLARSASADGHGDLKGYLDQRSPGFLWMRNNEMPLDIGWYYAYDVNCTIDMYEYILLATLAYDSSMSLQVSVSAAHRHPFIWELLDRIGRFETLRLSGRITDDIREKIKIDPKLGGKKPEEIAESWPHLRKEYRLLGEPGKERLQRVVYTPWKKIAAPGETEWDVDVAAEPGSVRVGLNVHLLPEAKERTLTDPFVEIDGKRIAVKATLVAGQYLFQWPDEETRQYGPTLKPWGAIPPSEQSLKTLAPGTYKVKFGAADLPPCRVRLSLQPDEQIVIP